MASEPPSWIQIVTTMPIGLSLAAAIIAYSIRKLRPILSGLKPKIWVTFRLQVQLSLGQPIDTDSSLTSLPFTTSQIYLPPNGAPCGPVDVKPIGEVN